MSTAPLHNRYSDEFFEQLAPPIDLTDGKTHVAPHLVQGALLAVGGEFVVIQPELDLDDEYVASPKESVPILRPLQDYKIVALDGIATYMQEQGVLSRAREERFLRAAKHMDALTAYSHGLPPGMAIVHHGEEAQIGLESTPQLRLGDTVSPEHVKVQIKDIGIVIKDLDTANVTRLYLSPADTNNTGLPKPNQLIETKLRDDLHRSFSGLMEESQFRHDENGLVVYGSFVATAGSPFHTLKLDIYFADEYPDLNTPEGYMMQRITIDPTIEGSAVMSVSDGEERVPGITKTNKHSQLTPRQAQQLLQLAAYL